MMATQLTQASINLAALVTEEAMAATSVLVLPSEEAFIRETRTGLRFQDDTPIEVWSLLTVRLIVQHKRQEWAIADSINFGRRAYGEVYTQWVQQTGLAKQTLANIAWVGRQIESSRRREDVEFGVYREVAALEPRQQENVLDAAVAGGWNRFEVREAVKSVKAGREILVDVQAASTEPKTAPTCAGDAPWQPTPDDLLPEHRAALQAAALDADLPDPRGFSAGALWAFRYCQAELMFVEGRWRDE